MKDCHVLKLVNTSVRDDPRLISEARSLIRLGYSVKVIGLARQAGLPVYDQMDGFDVILVPMVTQSHPVKLLQALWRFLRADLGDVSEVPDSRTSNMISFLFFNLWLIRIGIGISAQVVHCHDVLPLPAAWVLACWKHSHFIYDARESVPDLYIGIKGRLITFIEQRILRKADVVITVGERLARALSKRGARRVMIIGNWKRLDDFQIEADRIEAIRQHLQLSEYKLVISYFGSLDPTRDIMPLIRAVAHSPEVALLIAGRGTLEVEVAQASSGVPNIRWLKWISLADLPLYTHLSDALYYCLNFNQSEQQELSIGNNFYSTPNKLFEAFAAGKAIIARRGIGEIGEILDQIPAGILLDEVTPQTLYAAFQQLQNPDILQALQSAALDGRMMYSWDVAEERLKQIYGEWLSIDQRDVS
jgi:glycosyltransferase involved in cell wall biosynthesis